MTALDQAYQIIESAIEDAYREALAAFTGEHEPGTEEHWMLSEAARIKRKAARVALEEIRCFVGDEREDAMETQPPAE
jgi:hypothetical protein